MSIRKEMIDKLYLLDVEIAQLQARRKGVEFVIQITEQADFSEEQEKAILASYGIGLSISELGVKKGL
jgi:hypothetical protein